MNGFGQLAIGQKARSLREFEGIPFPQLKGAPATVISWIVLVVEVK